MHLIQGFIISIRIKTDSKMTLKSKADPCYLIYLFFTVANYEYNVVMFSKSILNRKFSIRSISLLFKKMFCSSNVVYLNDLKVYY